MAEGVVDPKLLKKQTLIIQDILGKFVKKPPLLDKNLARPPFRFLHDIFMTVMQTTGFFQGLYTPGEIDSSELNSREEKSIFLQKSIDLIALVTGKEVDIRVGRVLAGQDPERTNEVLIALAEALQEGKSSRKAVEKLTGIDPGESNSKKDSKPEIASKKDSKQNVSTRKEPAAVEKKGSNSYLAGSKGKQDAKKTSTSQQPKAPERDKKSKTSEPPKIPAKASNSTSNTKVKPNPYEKQGTKPKPQPMKVQAPPKGQKTEDEKGSNSRSRRGSVADVEPSPGSRRGSIGTKVALSRSSSNQSIQEKKVTEPASKVKAASSNESVKEKESVKLADPQFMGEVESLLQEHGIEVDPSLELETVEKSAPRRSAAARSGTLQRKKSPKMDSSSAAPKSSHAEVEVEEELTDDQSPVHEPIEEPGDVASSPSPDLIPPIPKPKSAAKSATTPSKLPASSLTRPGSNLGRASASVSAPRIPTAKAAPKIAVGPGSSAVAAQDSKSNTAPAVEPDSPDQFFDTISNRPQTNRMRRPPSAAGGGGALRPTSARPAPPRPLTARVENPEAFRPPTSSIPLILESEKLEEDDEYMIAQEKATQGLLDTLGENLVTHEGGDGDNEFSNFDSKGHLVHQIMETKRELEIDNQRKSDGNVAEEDMDKVRNATKTEVDKLKGLIQNMARVSNPIGKLLDYINEDIETMAVEFKKYKEESKQLQNELNREEEESRKELLPLERKVFELEEKLDLQDAESMTAYTAVLAMEKRFTHIVSAIEKVDESVEREIPRRFSTVYQDEEVDLDEVDELLAQRERETEKPYLLFGSHPWGSPADTLLPKTQVKQPKNIMKQKKEFKMGMVPQEFYEPGELEMVPVKPRRRFRRKASTGGGLLQPPQQLDSLEILKMMEQAREAENQSQEIIED